MENITDLKNKKTKYENLKTNIKSIRNELKSAKDALAVPAEKIGNLYNLDSIGIDSGSLASKIEEINTLRSYLYNNVLDKINDKIDSLEAEIESAGG